MVTIALVAAMLVGATLQRIAGMGFAMVVAPLALLLLPGQEGVVLANVWGMVASLILIWPVRKDVEWPKVSVLVSTSLVGALLGAVVIRALDASTFKIVVGLILIVAILVSLVIAGTSWMAKLWPATTMAGTGTGMLITMSGIGGPVMTVYSVITRWEHRKFAASMQPFVAVVSGIGAVAALLASPGSFPTFALPEWSLMAAALLAGLFGARYLEPFITPKAGRIIVVILGLLGAVSAVISGIGMRTA